MKDYILETNKMFKLRVYDTQDFVIFYIIEPGKKLYYVQHDSDVIHCVSGKNYGHLFTSRFNAQCTVDILKNVFDIDFSIEPYI